MKTFDKSLYIPEFHLVYVWNRFQDCPLQNLPQNTQLNVASCQSNLPGWRGASCALECEPNFYLKPVGANAKMPKKDCILKAVCRKWISS